MEARGFQQHVPFSFALSDTLTDKETIDINFEIFGEMAVIKDSRGIKS